MIKEAKKEANNVLDRSIYEDALFMKMNTDMGNATAVEYATYQFYMEKIEKSISNKTRLLHFVIKFGSLDRKFK